MQTVLNIDIFAFNLRSDFKYIDTTEYNFCRYADIIHSQLQSKSISLLTAQILTADIKLH